MDKKDIDSSLQGFAQVDSEKQNLSKEQNEDLTEDGLLEHNNYSANHFARNNDYDELDKTAPELQSTISRGVNRKAVFFIAALTLFGLVALFWVVSAIKGHGNEVHPVVKEVKAIVAPPLTADDFNINQTKIADVKDVKDVKPINVIPNKPQEKLSNKLKTKVPAEPGQPKVDPLVAIRMDSNKSDELVKDANKVNAADELQGGMGVAKGTVLKLKDEDKLLLRGTYLRCILETRIVSDYPGFTSCVITEPVYSENGRTLLIPKGSKASGQYGGARDSKSDSARVLVIWNRITTPTGLDVRIGSPGVDGLGSAGHEGYLETHWLSRFSAAIMVSMLSDAVQYAATKYGPPGNTISTLSGTQTNPFESETADTLKSAVSGLLEGIGKAPTVIINQGTLLNIYTARDIDFSSVMKD